MQVEVFLRQEELTISELMTIVLLISEFLQTLTSTIPVSMSTHPISILALQLSTHILTITAQVSM